MTFVLPLWVALVLAAALIFIAWNAAVSGWRPVEKDAVIGACAVVVVLALLGGFHYGPLYRPLPPAHRAGCAGPHTCVRLP